MGGMIAVSTRIVVFDTKKCKAFFVHKISILLYSKFHVLWMVFEHTKFHVIILYT